MTRHGLFMYCTEINIFACGSDIWLYRKDKATHCVRGLLSTTALLNLIIFCLSSLRPLEHDQGLEEQHSNLDLPKV